MERYRLPPSPSLCVGLILGGDCYIFRPFRDTLPLHMARSSLAMGMPTPRDHARMLEALSTHALELVRRDAAAAALLVTLHLPPSEQEALLLLAQVCVRIGYKAGEGGRERGRGRGQL